MSLVSRGRNKRGNSGKKPRRDSRRLASCEVLETRVLLSTINWANRNDAANGFAATFGANVAAARAVVDAVLEQYERTIVDFNWSGGIAQYDLNFFMRTNTAPDFGGLCPPSELALDGSGGAASLDARSVAATLARFAAHLRLILLLPVCTDERIDDPGRVVMELAAELHRAGMAAVVAPRVSLPAASLAGVTTTFFRALLGDVRAPPASLENDLMCFEHGLLQSADAAAQDEMEEDGRADRRHHDAERQLRWAHGHACDHIREQQ